MRSGYKWRPITDLEGDPKSLTDGELISLARVWEDQKKELVETGTLDEFEKRIRREWSIETGIIEDAYTLTPGVTRTLIITGIDAERIGRGDSNKDPAYVARIIKDHYDALEGMLDFVGHSRPLSVSYVKELHAALLRNIHTHTGVDPSGKLFEKELLKGAFKTMPSSPQKPDGSLHEYCPVEHTESEMDELVRMYLAHEDSLVPVEVEAAWLHHRFTQIHPFSDGNGRVARALASLVLIRANWFPLIIRRDDRTRYLDALESADAGDLKPLVALIVESERRSLIEASEIAYEVSPITSTHDAVLAVRDRLQRRGRIALGEWVQEKTVADALRDVATTRLSEVAQDLWQQVASLGKGWQFSAFASEHTDAREAGVRAHG